MWENLLSPLRQLYTETNMEMIKLKETERNTIRFSVNADTNSPIEVLKFTEDKMFLYGKEVEAPEEIIEGMRTFLDSTKYFELKEKADKYDSLTK